MNTTSELSYPLLPVVNVISSTLLKVQNGFDLIPGSPILVRYVRSSYQNDPYRSLLELFLVVFALRTLFSSRTRGEGQSKNWVELTEKEINELVDDWQPAPLIDAPANKFDHTILPSLPVVLGPASHKPKLAATGKQVLNVASPNWIGLLDDERIKKVAIDTLRGYGLSPCGPPGFYGTLDVHTQLEKDIANFLGMESAIIYSQSFSTITSVIPAFAKRGDIVIADKSVNFAIQKGLQIARCTVKWYEHNDMADLERQLKAVEKEAKRKGGPLKRRFIVTEGLFENDGVILDLAKVVELKKKYKWRLILDESFSFGMVGKGGRGVTELCGVPAAEVDILVGSMAVGLNAGGGFCAGSVHVTHHQRINGAAFVYSAAMPGLLATTGSEAIKIMKTTPAVFTALADNIRTFRLALQKLENASIFIPSDTHSALIHIYMLSPPESLEQEEKLLQDVVDDALGQGVMITRAARLRGQETFEPAPSLKIMLSAAFSKKEVEKIGSVIRGSLTKVLGKRR